MADQKLDCLEYNKRYVVQLYSVSIGQAVVWRVYVNVGDVCPYPISCIAEDCHLHDHFILYGKPRPTVDVQRLMIMKTQCVKIN